VEVLIGGLITKYQQTARPSSAATKSHLKTSDWVMEFIATAWSCRPALLLYLPWPIAASASATHDGSTAQGLGQSAPARASCSVAIRWPGHQPRSAPNRTKWPDLRSRHPAVRVGQGEPDGQQRDHRRARSGPNRTANIPGVRYQDPQPVVEPLSRCWQWHRRESLRLGLA